ncbi:MAG: hypothetical protein LBS12_00950 [Prevotellaceae bacterium]|jgi:hypothetical protein|nr:hypothetical protein [Prevotellaceae bacterium]
MNLDYIPGPDALFDVWQGNFKTHAKAGATRFGIPAAVIEELEVKQTRWETAFAIANDLATRTQAAVKEKQEARDDYEAELRRFIKAYLAYNPAVKNPDRENMGLHIHKTTRTDSPVAPYAPVINAKADGTRRVRFDFGESLTSKAKPAGQHSVRIAWIIREEAPTSYDELLHTKERTRTPLILTFDVPKAGKRLWFAARWVNNVEKEGPWTEIQSVVIP